MNYTKANSRYSNGTSFQGILEADYEDLVRVFGKPLLGSGDGKVQAEWVLRFENDSIATIYDYKENRDKEFVTNWHIGGKSSEVVALVNNVYWEAK